MSSPILCTIYAELLDATKLGMEECNDEKWLRKNSVNLELGLLDTWLETQRILRRQIRAYAKKKGVTVKGLRFNQTSISFQVTGPCSCLYAQPSAHPRVLHDSANAVLQAHNAIRNGPFHGQPKSRIGTSRRIYIIHKSIAVPTKGAYEDSALIFKASYSFMANQQGYRGINFVRPGAGTLTMWLKQIVDFMANELPAFNKAVREYWEEHSPLFQVFAGFGECKLDKVSTQTYEPSEFGNIYFGGGKQCP